MSTDKTTAPAPKTRGSALRAHYERELIRIIDEWEQRREVCLSDPEAKARFIILRSFELATTEGSEDCPTCNGTGKEGLHSLCRDCDEHPSSQTNVLGIPEGWKLVPRTPTDAMMQAGLYQSSNDATWSDVYSSWVDMVDAAEAPPVLATTEGSQP